MIGAATSPAREAWAAEHLRPVNNLGAQLIAIGKELRALYGESPPTVGSDDDLREYMAALDKGMLTPILTCVRAFNEKVPS